MTDDDEGTLHPATIGELEDSLSFALRYEGRKRVHTADGVMARVTAERLVRHLQQSGYVLMRCKSAVGFGADQHDKMLKSPVTPGSRACADSHLRRDDAEVV